MKRTASCVAFASTLAASMLFATAASADAPQWVERRTVPDAKVAGSVDLGFGLGSRVLRVAGNDFRYTGLGWNFEGAVSFLRRIEIGLRFGVRATDDTDSSYEITNDGPVKVSANASEIEFQQFRLKGEDTRLSVTGRIGATGKTTLGLGDSPT